MHSEDSAAEAFFDAKSIYRTTAGLSARASAYHEHMTLDEESRRIFKAVERSLPTQGLIVDLGCGIGESLLPIGPQMMDDGNIIGLDISLAALREMRGRSCGRARKLACADVSSLPFPDRCFSLAVARHMLYHVRDLAAALSEIGRILDNGGVLLATTNSVHSKAGLFDLHRKALEHMPGARAIARGSGNFSAEEGGRLLRSAFREVQKFEWRGQFVFPDSESALAYYVNTVYFKRAFDRPADRERLAKVAHQLLYSAVAEQGCFTVSNSGAAFVARR